MTPPIERIAVPSLPKGGVRKKMPAPFRRPSISVGAGYPPGERREWRTIAAQDIQVGDIVPGVGRVFTATESLDTTGDDVIWTVTVIGGTGNQRRYQGGETVWVFTSVQPTDA